MKLFHKIIAKFSALSFLIAALLSCFHALSLIKTTTHAM